MIKVGTSYVQVRYQLHCCQKEAPWAFSSNGAFFNTLIVGSKGPKGPVNLKGPMGPFYGSFAANYLTYILS